MTGQILFRKSRTSAYPDKRVCDLSTKAANPGYTMLEFTTADQRVFSRVPVSREIVASCMRMLLGVEPDGDAVLDFHGAAYDTPEALRDSFLRTSQAHDIFAKANSRTEHGLSPRSRYMIPPFLLRPPAFDNVPWRFAEPSLDAPVTQLCTAEQMATPIYRELCSRLGQDASAPHRKVWEFAFILAALESKGVLAPGRRGVGFGAGTEPLPSVFAKAGVEVVATDAPADLNFEDTWAHSSQWSQGLEELWHPNLVDRADFFDRVQFRPADMNNIPTDLRDFDFCWSACAFEHLGGLRQGLDYLHNCLDTLKPGRISVQTTEFNLMSNTDTLDLPGLYIFRKQDFETVIHELVSEGHKVEPLNLWPGATPVDEHIDLPPFSSPHLKLEFQGWQITSIGIIVTKKTD